jgi:hypothetical protein
VTGGQPNPSGVTVQPSTGTNNPSISPTPCTAGGTAVATSHEKSNHHSHNGNISGFMETLLRFFIELINLLLKLIGGGQINLPNPDPSNPDPGNPCNT